MKKYYLHDGNEQQGPFDLNELKEKNIHQESPIWYDGIIDWTTAGKVDELQDILKTKTPPPFGAKKSTPPPIIHKKKVNGQIIKAKSTFSGIFFPSLGQTILWTVLLPIILVLKMLSSNEPKTKEEAIHDENELRDWKKRKREEKGVKANFWDLLTPWEIIIDTNKNLITTRKRNWYLLNFDESTYSYQTVGDVSIIKHLLSSDIEISVFSEQAVKSYDIAAYRIDKASAKRIKAILLNEA